MKNIKDIIIGLSVLLLYLLSSTLFPIMLKTFNIDYNTLHTNIKITINILYELAIIVIIVGIYHKKFKKDFFKFKNNLLEYLNNYLKYWIIAISLMIISNLIISKFGINIANNEKEVLETFHKFPLYTIITAVIFAPILEESVFRLAISKIIRNKYLFIILSGLLFGLLHVSIADSFKQLIYIIPYSIPGFIFAYTLVKSENIFVPISLHLIHNSILIIGQIILIII